MKTPKHRGRRLSGSARDQGSVLVLTLIIISALSMLSVSMMESARGQVEMAQGATISLRSQMMADSALEYALRQIANNPDWMGTGGEWIGVTTTDMFQVARLDDGGDPKSIHILMAGRAGSAVREREAILSSSSGGGSPALWTNKALAQFVGDFNFVNVSVTGDLLLVDIKDGVLDYNPVTQEFEPSSIPDVEFSDTNWTIWDGNVYTYGQEGGSAYFNSKRLILKTPVQVPVWDLDEYIVPGPDRIVTSETNFNGVVTEKTLVIVADPGVEIDIKNSTLAGGLVIYAEPDLDPRGPARNRVRISSTDIGGGVRGIDRRLAVIAPGTHLSHYNNSFTLNGLTHFHSAGHLNNLENEGPVFFTKGAEKINNMGIVLPDEFWGSEPPAGLLNFNSGLSSPKIVSIWESWDREGLSAY